MNRARSLAYLRVLRTLHEIGPATLWPKEQACVREAADALLFCTDIANDRAAQLAVGDIAALSDDLDHRLEDSLPLGFGHRLPR